LAQGFFQLSLEKLLTFVALALSKYLATQLAPGPQLWFFVHASGHGSLDGHMHP